MLQRYTLTSDQIDAIIENQAIPEEITRSAANVAVILTQSWCGQWHFMQAFLKQLDKKGVDLDLHVYELEYDDIPQQREFMAFKEDVLENSLIPFVLYYKDGEKVGESNYAGRHQFVDTFTG